MKSNCVFPDYVITEIFIYYNFPQLFTVKDRYGANYLSLAIADDDNDQPNRWLVVSVSPSRMSALRNRIIDLHHAYINPELGILIEIRRDSIGKFTSHILLPKDLNLDLIPLPGEVIPSGESIINHDKMDYSPLLFHEVFHNNSLVTISDYYSSVDQILTRDNFVPTDNREAA